MNHNIYKGEVKAINVRRQVVKEESLASNRRSNLGVRETTKK